jgi:hypothetical protein
VFVLLLLFVGLLVFVIPAECDKTWRGEVIFADAEDGGRPADTDNPGVCVCAYERGGVRGLVT